MTRLTRRHRYDRLSQVSPTYTSSVDAADPVHKPSCLHLGRRLHGVVIGSHSFGSSQAPPGRCSLLARVDSQRITQFHPVVFL